MTEMCLLVRPSFSVKCLIQLLNVALGLLEHVREALFAIAPRRRVWLLGLGDVVSIDGWDAIADANCLAT